MICPKCLHKKTRIYNSRFTKHNNQTWRRRTCDACGYSFTTRELVEADKLLSVVTRSGERKPYSRSRIFLDIATACMHLQDTSECAQLLAETVEARLLKQAHDGVVYTSEIAKVIAKALKAFDIKAYLRYASEYEAIQDNRDLKNILRD
ncbi:MAG TPA: ATP cone domain-containing protein [Candidatus Saccharimonadales bacterium]|nr:ATP cone domain-containing protein [Candidatus Saccharimonadales bacterium]